MANLNTIKNWFKTGLKPTQQQFWDTWDSFWHKEDNIPVANIEGIDSLLNQKSNKSVVDNHLTDANAHANEFSLKEDKSKKGQAEGYSPLDSDNKIPSIHLKIVDDLTSGGRESLLSAEQGKELRELIGNKQNIKGTNYSYVNGAGTAPENGIELQQVYTIAKAISGLSATNRFKIIVGAGKYEFTDIFQIDTQYIDFVSLTGDSDVEFTSGINVITNDVYLRGLKTETSFTIGDNLSLLKCENCVGGYVSFGNNVTVSGIFINCIAGSFSFGGDGTASGTFINCSGGTHSFGGYGTASGTFTNCSSGENSFGGYGTASGTFTNCISNERSFGGYGTASGTFINCSSGINSFGGNGTASGKLFYCRLREGIFSTVSSGGRTYYCIDGNGNPNNQ